MPGIDEVSQAIGEIRAQNSTIITMLRDQTDHLRTLNGRTTTTEVRLANLAEEAVTKKQVMRAAIVVGGLTGVGGASITTFLKSLLAGM